MCMPPSINPASYPSQPVCAMPNADALFCGKFSGQGLLVHEYDCIFGWLELACRHGGDLMDSGAVSSGCLESPATYVHGSNYWSSYLRARRRVPGVRVPTPPLQN